MNSNGCSHNTLFVGLLFPAPEPSELIVGNFVFDHPRGTRAEVIVVVIVRFFLSKELIRKKFFVFSNRKNKTKN